MKQFKIKYNSENFTVKIKDLKANSNYNISVSVYDHTNDLICGWHDKHTKSKEDIKEDVFFHLSNINDSNIFMT